MKIQARKDIARIIREDVQAVDDAIVRGVKKAVRRHRKEDVPMAVERDGKVEYLKPEDLVD